MRARSGVYAMVMGLVLPVLCSAQSRLGRTVPSSDPPLGWSGSFATGSPGMFGGRSLGSSLTPGNRSFARGVAGPPAPAGVGITQRIDPGIGLVNGNERFLRDARPVTAFVGADPGDASFPDEAMVGLGVPGAPSGPIPQAVAARVDASRANANRVVTGPINQLTPTRVARSLVFAGPTTPASETQLVARIKSRPAFKALGPIELDLQQRTIVLRGTVARAHDRDLAARLALLEAGVDAVQNELVVIPPGR